MKNRWLRLITIVAALCVLAYYLADRTSVLDTEDNKLQFFYLAVLLCYLVFASRFFKTLPKKDTLRYILIWIGIFIGGLLLYSYKDLLEDAKNRLIAALVPSHALIHGDEVHIAKSQDGHFYVDTEIEGISLRLMLDSGASRIFLTRKDATRMGINVENLTYNVRTSTASGVSYVAPIILDSVTVGSIQMRDVKAAVSKDNMDQSLLGMSFLNRLSSWHIEGDLLILEQRH